jgi:hypothetical protein
MRALVFSRRSDKRERSAAIYRFPQISRSELRYSRLSSHLPPACFCRKGRPPIANRARGQYRGLHASEALLMMGASSP